MSRGYIDLHCHWIAGIDDGARSVEESLRMLSQLHAVGFSTVIATPHMRPGMFDNDAAALRAAYEAMAPHLGAASGLPAVGLASEHFFDGVVFERMMRGDVLPYPDAPGAATPAPPRKKRSVLVELPTQAFPVQLAARMFDLQRAGLCPVLAHPERYRPVWSDDACLDPLLDAGVVLLLDVCAVVGKYGRAAQKAAEKLLEEEAYEAACSDAHRPEDADMCASAFERLERLVGKEERHRLLVDGPAGILRGR